MTTDDADVRPPLSDEVIAVAAALNRGLTEILGDAIASFFLYGAVAFPRPEGWKIDFDFHVLLHRAPDESERAAITDLYTEVGARSELGRELDGYFVLLTDATGSDPPRHQLDLTIRDEAWALHRAHVLAGRYFLVTGTDPREIVTQPSWAELETALRAEVAFITAHPDAPAFGILNGARILYSFATHNVVVSKYEAGQWALDSLPREWHDVVRAALRFYSGAAADGDDLLFDECWAPYGAYVTRSLHLD